MQTLTKFKKALLGAIVAALGAALASGCAAAVVAGGAASGLVANDERTAGSYVEDQSIKLKINFQVSEQIGRRANINTTSYNRRVLLTGQVPDAETRALAVAIARGIDNVRDVIDELEIGNPSSLTARASDAALTTQVKTTLCSLRNEGFSCLDIKVTTERGVVYLMGLVTKQQEEVAVAAARRVSGVIGVKTLFERAQAQ